MLKWLLFLNLMLAAPHYIETKPQFTWHNVEVTVPVYEALENYLDVPYATLPDGLDDPNIYYQKNGVNYTFQSVIQTSITKTYRLDYKVTSPKYGISSIHTIYFTVIDSIPPEFLSVEDLVSPVNQTVDYTYGIHYKDNYNTNDALILTVFHEGVLENQVGTYYAIYELKDTASNLTRYTRTIQIVDLTPPSITQINPILLNPNETWTFTDYFIIHDNYSQAMDIFIDDSIVDYSVLGSYSISITIKDSSLNETTLVTYITIQDQEPPTILLRTLYLEYEIGESFDLKDNILKVSDNFTDLNTEDITIETDYKENQVGFYLVCYQVSDEALLKRVQCIPLYIRDQTPPLIESTELLIPLGKPIYYMEGISVSDASNIIRFELLTHNVKNHEGNYQALYLATDEFGNSTYYLRNITLYLKETPSYWLYGIIPLSLILGGGFYWIIKKKFRF